MIERWEDSTRRLQAEYDEHISDGLKMRILLEMVRPYITESFMAKLPDMNAKDEDGKEIAKYITKEILVQHIEAKTDFGSPMPIDWGSSGFPRRRRRRDGSNEGSNGEVHALGKGFGRKSKGCGGKSGVGAPFAGQCNACGEYGHKPAH